jgi:integrase
MSRDKKTRWPGVYRDSTTGSYGIKWDGPPGPDGQRRQRRRRNVATSGSEAARIRADLMGGGGVEEPASSPATGGVTVAEWVETFKAAKRSAKRSHNTLRQYDDRLARIVDRLGTLELSNAEAIRAGTEAIYAEMASPGGRRDGGAGPVSSNTLRRTHSVWRAVLNYAVRRGVIPANPIATLAEAVPSQAVADLEAEENVVALTVDQLARLLLATDATELACRYRFAAATGLRPGEVLGLTWDRVDLEAEQVQVLRGATYPKGEPPSLKELKGRRQRRSVDLDSDTVTRLRAHRRDQAAHAVRIGAGRAWNPLDLVFPNLDGTIARVDSWGDHLGRVLADLEEKRSEALKEDPDAQVVELPACCTPKTFRHTHATLIMRLGRDPLAASRRLGHASAAFTMDRYGHELPGQQREAADLVAHALAAAGA